MRFIGCLLIALAGAGLGLYGSHRLRRRAAYLHQTVSLLRALERQLPYTALPMAILWQQLAASGAYEDCRLLQDTVDALREDTAFIDAFSAAVDIACGAGLLTEAGRGLLQECGVGFGRYDLTRQTAHLQYYGDRAEEMATALMADASVQGRLYRVTGLAGGVALALLLL